jgi:hypothetical protein
MPLTDEQKEEVRKLKSVIWVMFARIENKIKQLKHNDRLFMNKLKSDFYGN